MVLLISPARINLPPHPGISATCPGRPAVSPSQRQAQTSTMAPDARACADAAQMEHIVASSISAICVDRRPGKISGGERQRSPSGRAALDAPAPSPARRAACPRSMPPASAKTPALSRTPARRGRRAHGLCQPSGGEPGHRHLGGAVDAGRVEAVGGQELLDRAEPNNGAMIVAARRRLNDRGNGCRRRASRWSAA